MKKSSIIAGIMALVFLVSVLVGTSAVVLAQGPCPGHKGEGFWSNLTDEQRVAVQEKKKEMRSQGATREEIRAAVAEMLKDYGIEVPEDWHGPKDFGHGKAGFKANLTEEQREAIREKKEEMRSQGATREEIRSAKVEMLKGYGIELPENWKGPYGPAGFGPGPGGFWKDLTDEQREAVRDKIKEMRDQGASREEIRDAVAEMLKGYGIELPENWRGPYGPAGFGPGQGGFWLDLTDEQREAVHDKIKEMRDQGASREEIHAAIAEMLKGYGIELTENWHERHGPRGFGYWRGCFGADLTDEQKKAVREKVREMRTQGATREEIRAEVAEMFEGYGIELPGFLSELTDEQRKAIRKKIREMRSQGVGCEEIRAAVAEILQGYGIELPENSEGTSSDKSAVKPHILAQSYPNPFNPETQISYTVSVSENVKIQIYNVSGQLIRTYDLGYQPAGTYSVRWDGRNESGDRTASGIYLYRIEAGPYEVTNRMVLLK